jgi:hypothetical protein
MQPRARVQAHVTARTRLSPETLGSRTGDGSHGLQVQPVEAQQQQRDFDGPNDAPATTRQQRHAPGLTDPRCSCAPIARGPGFAQHRQAGARGKAATIISDRQRKPVWRSAFSSRGNMLFTAFGM